MVPFQPPTISRLASLVAVLSATSALASGAAPSLEKAFSRAARLEGRAYATGRGLLERQGRRILPFLEQKAKNPEWRERDLARALILRIGEPKETALRLRAFSGWNHTFTFREDGTVHVRFDPKEADYVKRMLSRPTAAPAYMPPVKELPEGNEVLLDRRAVPLILDFMREWVDERSRRWSRSLEVLRHFAAPESAAGVLSFYGKSPGPEIVDVLVAIGGPALPVLREEIRACTTERPQLGTEEARRKAREFWMALRRSAGAARALGRIGDREGALILVEKLKTATYPDQVEAFSAALGRMKTPEGMPVVFSHLVAAAGPYRRKRGSHSSNDPEYAPVRDAMLAFGDAAVRPLRARAAEGQDLPSRVIAAGLLFELEDPERTEAFYRAFGHAALARSLAMYGRRERDEKERDPLAVGRSSFWTRGGTVPERPEMPSPLLAERACVFAASADLVQLAGRKDCPQAFDVVAEGLLLMRGGDFPKIALALAEMGDERAVGAYSKLLGDRPTHYLSSLVEGMLLLGSQRAVPLLEEIIRRAGEGNPRYSRTYQPAAELSKAVLPALRGDREHLAKLLEHEKESVREVAARVLAKNGDLRALPVLVELASSVPKKAGAASVRKSYATATARRDRHVALRDAAVGLGQAALAPLEGLRKGAADARKRLLCESIIVRVSKPELVARFTKAARVRHPGFMKRSGPGVGDYMGAGKTLAAAVGEEAIPLLEEVVAFNSGPPGPGIAIFALAEFKRERSIPVIVESAMELRPYLARGGNLVAAALHEFGEKGIEAAKHIPAPDPQKAQYRGRASRHRAATGALALAKEVKGVENILEALAQPKQETEDRYAWLNRMRTFLKLAKNYRDDRVVEPATRFLQQEHESLWAPALEVLADYGDPKIAPLALDCLGRHDNRTFEMALKVLVKRFRGEVAAFLVKHLREAEDEEVRSGAAKALGALGLPGGSYWYQVFKERPEWEEAARRARSLAVGPLTTALEDKSDSVRAAAAGALAGIGPQLRTEERQGFGKALAAWVATQKKPSRRVVDYLVQIRETAIGPALLAAYRASGRKNSDLARMLGKAGNVDAVDDIARALDERIAAKRYNYGIPELKALGDLGAGGLDKVYTAFRDCPDLALRAHAASVLGQKGYRRAFGEIKELFEGLIEGGHWDPRLAGPGSVRQRNYSSYVDLLAGALASLDPRRAYPVLSAALLRVQDEQVRNRLSWRLRGLERADPTLKDLPVPLPEAPKRPAPIDEGRLPEIPFLRMCDLWRRALGGRQGRVLEDVRRELLQAGDDALAAMVELCFPAPGPPSAKAIAGAVARLADERARDEAVRLLALGQYPPPLLDELLATAKGESLLYGAAIRRWRGQGPWFLEKHKRLLGVATTMLEVHWPVDDIRRFAIAKLDRLAEVEKVEYHWSVKPLGPLLASIRYSPDPAERDLLAEFVTRARPGAREVAISVMKNGLTGRTRAGMAEHWKRMPKHKYRLDWLAQLDPSKPNVFKQAMYAAPRSERLRRRLHEVVLDDATDPKLRDEILGFLWHFMGDGLARDRFAADLLSEEYGTFRRALYRLTDSKFAYRGSSIIPHLKKVLEGDDAKRRIATIGRMDNYLGETSIRLAAKAVAPFLVSEDEKEREAARKTLTELQRKGWIDTLGELAQRHQDARVREEAAKLLKDNPPRGRAAKPKPEPKVAPKAKEEGVF